MQGNRFIAGLLLSGLSAGLFVAASHAADENMSGPATQPSAESPTHHSRKLFQPFGLLTDLSDDQKAAIEKIHATYLDDLKAAREKQDEAAMAVLTPDQKTEVQKAVDEKAAEAKEKSAGRRKQKMEAPTTSPTS